MNSSKPAFAWPAGRALFALLTLVLAMTAQTASAGAANAAACGGWAPGSGAVAARYIPSGPGHTYREYRIRVVFTFSPAAIGAIRCTGSRSLEVDAITYGGMQGGLRGWSSNLPSAYLDTEAFDGYPRVLTVGSTAVSNLVSNREYYTEITLREFGLTTGNEYAETYLNFQRGHWASSATERAVCLAHGGSDPAWCINADESITMNQYLGKAPRVLMGQPYSYAERVDWGGYRRWLMGSGARLNSGDRLVSANGAHQLIMQPDGNLCIYRLSGGGAVWCSNTASGANAGAILVAQDDGNFVVVAPGNRPVWATGTGVRGSTLELQNDRNLVVYKPGHVAIWASNTGQ